MQFPFTISFFTTPHILACVPTIGWGFIQMHHSLQNTVAASEYLPFLPRYPLLYTYFPWLISPNSLDFDLLIYSVGSGSYLDQQSLVITSHRWQLLPVCTLFTLSVYLLNFLTLQLFENWDCPLHCCALNPAHGPVYNRFSNIESTNV